MGEMCFGITVTSKKNKPLIESEENFKKRYDAKIEREDGRVIFKSQWDEWTGILWDEDAEIDHKNHMFIKYDSKNKKYVKIPFQDESKGWLSAYVFTGKRNIELIATKTDLRYVLKGLIIENIKEIEVHEWYG